MAGEGGAGEFFTVTIFHLEGVSRCILGFLILGRGDEVVTVARASHCDGRNRDISGKEVEERKKERARGVLTPVSYTHLTLPTILRV